MQDNAPRKGHPHAPMPEGVERMTKQELWDWFAASTRAHRVINDKHRRFFELTTGLNGCLVDNHYQQPHPNEVIEMQRKRILGLSQQMREMKKGYERKIARLEKKVQLANAPAAAKEAEGHE